MTKALIRALGLFAALIALTAAAQDKLVQPDYALGAGDAIRVQVFQNPELTIEARVSENGTINYPLIGSVGLGGLSIGVAEKKIADALKNGGFVKQPQVNILLLLVRGNQVSVLGHVARPGRYPLETFNTRASDMLATAGGAIPGGGTLIGATPGGSDIAVITGLRDGKPFRKEIDIPALYLGNNNDSDIVLSGGDTIFVERAPVFYIYGEAQRPGAYRIERGMTVMQALAQGGGPTLRGSQYRLRLNRKNAAGVVEKLAPEMTDPIQPNDVLYVRESIF